MPQFHCQSRASFLQVWAPGATREGTSTSPEVVKNQSMFGQKTSEAWMSLEASKWVITPTYPIFKYNPFTNHSLPSWDMQVNHSSQIFVGFWVSRYVQKSQNNHLGCMKPCKYWDKLPSSTGFLAGIQPSTTVWNLRILRWTGRKRHDPGRSDDLGCFFCFWKHYPHQW